MLFCTFNLLPHWLLSGWQDFFALCGPASLHLVEYLQDREINVLRFYAGGTEHTGNIYQPPLPSFHFITCFREGDKSGRSWLSLRDIFGLFGLQRPVRGSCCGFILALFSSLVAVAAEIRRDGCITDRSSCTKSINYRDLRSLRR
jgi:hypothetical protein